MSVYLEEREAAIFDRQLGVLARCGVAAPVIFDVGANVGQSVERYRAACPESTLHCFEPSPAAFETLAGRCRGQPGVFLRNLALSDREGSSPFYATQRSELSSLLRPESWLRALSLDDKYDFSELSVPCTTLDRYCEELGLDWIDILKIDVQGAEPNVLRGAQRVLGHARVGLVYLEVMLAETYVGQATLLQLLTLFEAFNYRLWDLLPFTYTSADAAWTANGLFVCPQWAGRIEAAARREISGETGDGERRGCAEVPNR
ncbi:FkbM family methyltransferase [Thiorhodococcus minor]|uniref:FkbM family methyltransferase n=1 Tax=Thiorhodococcus minor TaxID=57489 RepID=A0A6M0JSS7_9GAMM|nr:FkbM family methyltransferase [Thiorhodococcus minor]NEV60552.1 FkbM family methyltransferase [Thiorhodococcus minor]